MCLRRAWLPISINRTSTMNGIYLNLLLREISDKLVGTHVEGVCRHDRIVQLLLGENSLYASLYPTALGLFFSKSIARGYESLKSISSIVKGCRIAGVSQYDLTPTAVIVLSKSFPKRATLEIVISLYPQAPNFSLKSESWRRNVYARYIEKKPKTSILKLDENELADLTLDDLVRNYEGIDKRLGRELNPENLEKIKAILRGQAVRPRLVSMDPLHISLFAREFLKEYASFNELLESAITGHLRERETQSAEQHKRTVIRSMKKRLVRLRKRLLKPAEIENLRVTGDLILANLNKIRKDISSVEVFNPYTQSNMKIKIDPHLSPQDNAQQYFRRYKKEKRGQPKLKQQLAALVKEAEILEKMPQVEPSKRIKIAQKVAAKEPFHKFVLDSGSVVLVGKNAQANDELTFKYARPSDYFFHTRGLEGAHTLLQPKIPKGQRPSKDEVRIAASIAAFFSKAKKQKNVAVSYTQRKYLKKNKKGKPGSVIM
ncbi:MAG: NFACT RNA binding domain-containing protein, partial [Candidatus Hodarchaeota archaeon]